MPWKIEYDNSDSGQFYSVGPIRIEFPWNNPTKATEAHTLARLVANAPDIPELLDVLEGCAKELQEVWEQLGEQAVVKFERNAWTVKAEKIIAQLKDQK